MRGSGLMMTRISRLLSLSFDALLHQPTHTHSPQQPPLRWTSCLRAFSTCMPGAARRAGAPPTSLSPPPTLPLLPPTLRRTQPRQPTLDTPQPHHQRLDAAPAAFHIPVYPSHLHRWRRNTEVKQFSCFIRRATSHG